ncbi:MAG: radical SAM protein [Thermodesulfobacteriota bacterium]|nr:radical SAM protein [Thermodesulfobacteriota bacterium]
MKVGFIAKSAIARLRCSFGKTTPLRVLHRITTSCNLKCSFCDHQLHAVSKNELSTDEIKSAMDEFAAAGTIAWGITGGEPFLRRDLLEIIRHSKKLGFLTSCITNGTVAKDDQIAEAAKWLDYLVTSMEGPLEITDRIRGKGVFDKVVHTIEIARSNNLPVIVGTVITRDLLEAGGIEFMGKLCRQMGIRCSFQNLLLSGPYGGHGFQDAKPNIVPHEPSRRMLFRAIDEILAMRTKGYPFVNNKPWGDYVKAFINGNLKPPTCFAGRLYCNFFEDGVLRTCQYHPVTVKENTIAESIQRLPGEFKDCPCVAICYVNYNLALSFNLPMMIDGFRNALAGKH